jgi:hypothetical protein
MTKLEQANKLRTELAKVELEVVQELVDKRKRLERELKETNKEIERITGRKQSTGNGGSRIENLEGLIIEILNAGPLTMAELMNHQKMIDAYKAVGKNKVSGQFGKLTKMVEEKKIKKVGSKYQVK